MGSRVSFIRSNVEKLQIYLQDKQRLFDEVFYPDINDRALINHSDKSVEGILFLQTGNAVPNAETGIVIYWNFQPLIMDSEGTNVYYLEPLQVNELNKEFTRIGVAFIERNYDSKKMKTNNIYPDIWDKNEGYDGLTYLKDHFIAFQKFISDAVSNSQAVIALPT